MTLTTGTAPTGRRRLGEWNVGEGRRPAAPAGGGVARDRPVGPSVDPRMRQRAVEVVRERGRRRTRVTASIATVATVLVVAFGVLHTGLLGVRHVRIVGRHPGTDASLLVSAGLARGEPLIDVGPASAEGRLERLPWVATAEVHRSWPDSVAITVTSRQPVAQVPTGTSATGPVVTVDATGRVLARLARARADLPVVVGVRPGPVGTWLAGSAGSGFRPGAPATIPVAWAARTVTATDGVGGVLAAAAGVEALGRGRPLGPTSARVTRITATADGSLGAVVEPGAVTVVLGTPTELAAKVTALVSMLDAVHLPAGARLDLQVPDRPTVTTAPPS